MSSIWVHGKTLGFLFEAQIYEFLGFQVPILEIK